MLTSSRGRNAEKRDEVRGLVHPRADGLVHDPIRGYVGLSDLLHPWVGLSLDLSGAMGLVRVRRSRDDDLGLHRSDGHASSMRSDPAMPNLL